MSLFSSGRERRLWLWAISAVAAIYLTLGLVLPLTKVLRESGLLEASFVFAMLLVGAAVVTFGLSTRPGGAEIGVALGIIAVYLLVFIRMAIPEERTHLIEYGVVASLVYQALKERVSQGRRVPVPALLAAAITAVVGTVDECIQAFVPGRVFDPLDILFNILAGVMAISASVSLRWARRRVA